MRKEGRKGRWMSGCVNGWKEERMDGWTDGWMDEFVL
jgi:hypothetical protein